MDDADEVPTWRKVGEWNRCATAAPAQPWQAEAGRLREALAAVQAAIPGSDGAGNFIIDHHTADGEYAGTEHVDPRAVIYEIADIVSTALAESATTGKDAA